MYHVYVDPYMVLFVYDALNALGWGDQVVYTTIANFVANLSDAARVDMMHCLLHDAIWNTITHARIPSDVKTKIHTFSSDLMENVRSLLKCKAKVVSERPTLEEYTRQYCRQIPERRGALIRTVTGSTGNPVTVRINAPRRSGMRSVCSTDRYTRRASATQTLPGPCTSISS